MPIAQTSSWSTSYPDHWAMEESDDDSVLFYDEEEGVGTLEISCFCKDDAPVSREEVLDLAAESLELGARQMEVELGGMHGLMLIYTYEETAWKEWYLNAGNCLFFITYDCPEDMEGAEDEELVEIIENLQLGS